MDHPPEPPCDGAREPVVVFGFPYEFGAAPPDFEGRTIVDYSDVRSALGVGWGAEGTTAPFLMMDGEGLLLDHSQFGTTYNESGFLCSNFGESLPPCKKLAQATPR